jgi:hypothetical protein
LKVLLVGYDPASVDFSDPALPPGLDAEKIHAGIEAGLASIKARGWTADHCLIKPDSDAGPAVERCLAKTRYDCVVVGGGVRMSSRHLIEFEAVINAVHRAAPHAAIAFNTRPEDSAEAASRWLPADRA